MALEDRYNFHHNGIAVLTKGSQLVEQSDAQKMDFKENLTDAFGMIKQGLDGLAEARQTVYQERLDLLSRFEKRAAWVDDTWTYWDFETAPEERMRLDAQKITKRQAEQRCESWIAKDAATKTPLIKLIENGPRATLIEEVRALIAAGADPNEATLLKDTPLGYAIDHGYSDVFDLLIELGADGEKVGFSKLHHAVRYDTLAEVTRLIDTFDILWRGFDAPSVLEEAVAAQKPDVVASLLEHIVKQGRLSHDEVSGCFSIAASYGNPAAVRPFLEHGVNPDVALDATLGKFDTQMLKVLLAQGADVHQIDDIMMYHHEPLNVLDEDGSPAITRYIRTLLDAGWSVDDLGKFERDQVRYVTEAYLIPAQDTSSPAFLEPARMCEGVANPEERTTPYYLEMLRTGENSYQARQHMLGLPHAVWTAERFGQSTTRLPDGRWVQIGGEHEDHYDRDFKIFNDVVVHTPGEGARVFFYPNSIFPPTDFHSATLIEDAIWIIGGLSYAWFRQDDETPVYRLDLKDFSIERIETSGHAPGWISRHTAKLNGTEISVSGAKKSTGNGYTGFSDTFSLDTRTCSWKKHA